MLEEHLARLLLDTSTSFTKVTEILIVYSYFKMNYLGAIYPVSIKIREIERKYLIESRLKQKKSSNFMFRVLYSMIERNLSNNLETGNLIFPGARHLISVGTEKANSIGLYGCAAFINIYNDLKNTVRKICGSKTDMFKSLLSNGIDFKEMFRLAKIFTTFSDDLLREFKNLIEQSKGRFTPLMMIYGNYLCHVEQNKTVARKVLKMFINKPFYYDLMLVSGTTIDKNEELVTIGISAEKENFHRINLLSCNCFAYLEYDAFELIGQNLNCLLPSPLNTFHEQLVDPRFITGVLFEKKDPQQLMIKKKNGYMSVCKAITRMNYRVSDQLDIFAAVIFNKDTLGLSNIMIISEEMMISEISETATDLFEKGTYIYQYNKRFANIFSDLNYVCNFRLKSDHLGLDSIMKDKNILKHYQTYFDYLNGEEMNINDKYGCQRKVRVQINVTFMPTIQRYIRTMQYTMSSLDDQTEFMAELNNMDQNMSDNGRSAIAKFKEGKIQKFNYELLDKRELEVKKLLEYLQRTSILQISRGASNKVSQSVTGNFNNDESFLKGQVNPDSMAQKTNGDNSNVSKAINYRKTLVMTSKSQINSDSDRLNSSDSRKNSSSARKYKSKESIERGVFELIA